MYIGKVLKRLRKEKGIKLTALAELTGIQAATLSRMENLKMRGTVDSHMKIARALSINLTELYSEAMKSEEAVEIKNMNQPLEICSHNAESSYAVLTSNALSKKMLPALLQIKPKGRTDITQSPLGSEKFVYVLEGSIEVLIEDKRYSLNTDNSLYFNASFKHSFLNNSNLPAKILSMITPATL